MVSTSKAVYLWLQPDDGEAELGFSGKMGIGVCSCGRTAGIYGEVSAAKFDDVDAGYGLKAGC